ncbi:acylphosphatase [Microbacterium tumbae]
MTAVRLSVHGRVQGVGYRWFTRRAAEAHGLSGWVRNRRDGTVEAELHGAEEAVDAVIAAMRRGPAHGRVDEVRVLSDEILGEPNGFEILPTA